MSKKECVNLISLLIERFFFPPEKYHPEESLRILIPEGQIKFLNPQKYIAN